MNRALKGENMSLARIKSYGLDGLEGYEIDIEVDLHKGIPSYDIVGLPDASVKESRERVKSAFKNNGFNYPIGKIVVNLAPADTKKEGSMYDLALAMGLLCSTQQIMAKDIGDYIIIGELSLNGDIRSVRGVLPILISARQKGVKKAIIPLSNANEAKYIEGVDVYAFEKLSDVCAFFTYEKTFEPIPVEEWRVPDGIVSDYDMKFVKGQYAAKRATEIAVAGGHNLLYIGPPGAGKTMMAKSVVTIMPDLTFDEALETTKIHSVAGILDERDGFVSRRPFRTPHHTATVAAMAGGGVDALPGEISLAHNGVLFLDELPEYPRKVLETLRQPLEDNTMTVSRQKLKVEYPSNFILIASMNPCPCGNYGSKERECRCTPTQIHKYLNKLSGPLLDRIDIHIDVDGVTYGDITDKKDAESSAVIKKRVNEARAIQRKRYEGSGKFCNAQMNNSMMLEYCKLDSKSEALLEAAFSKLKLSARAYSRILKVARTIADLEGKENIQPMHIAEAIQYRSLDRKYEI